MIHFCLRLLGSVELCNSKAMNDANLLRHNCNLQLRYFATTLCLSVERNGAHTAMRVIEALDPLKPFANISQEFCCSAATYAAAAGALRAQFILEGAVTSQLSSCASPPLTIPTFIHLPAAAREQGEDTAASPRCCCRCADANCGRGATVPVPLSFELTLASRVCASRRRRLWWKGGGQARRHGAPSLEAEGVASCSRAVCKALSSSTCKM